VNQAVSDAKRTQAPDEPTAADEVAVVRVRGLVKERSQAGITFRLEVPELSLHRGEVVALSGESGCGKSTLLDLLALVLRPTEVELFELFDPIEQRSVDVRALWRDGDENGLARARRTLIGYVLQSGGLLPFLDVWHNISLPQRLSGRQGRDLQQLAQAMGVSGVLTKKPQYLSGGQRQRVAILRAIAHSPGFILADEPTAAVDSRRAQAIMRDFRDLARVQGCAVIIVSHDRRLIDPVADRFFSYHLEAVSEQLTRSVCRPERGPSP